VRSESVPFGVPECGVPVLGKNSPVALLAPMRTSMESARLPSSEVKMKKIALSSTVLYGLLISGCGDKTAVNSTLTHVAPPGFVKISPQRILETATEVHWKWSIVGDRYWTNYTNGLNPAKRELIATISKSYPLTGNTQNGGSNIVFYDLDIKATKYGKLVLFSCSSVLSNGSGTKLSQSGSLDETNEANETDLRKVAVALVTTEVLKHAPGKIPLLRLEFAGKNGKTSQIDVALDVVD